MLERFAVPRLGNHRVTEVTQADVAQLHHDLRHAAYDAMPATNGNSTSRNKATTAMTAASIAIQNNIGRVKLMVRQLDLVFQRITAARWLINSASTSNVAAAGPRATFFANEDCLKSGISVGIARSNHRAKRVIALLRLVL